MKCVFWLWILVWPAMIVAYTLGQFREFPEVEKESIQKNLAFSNASMPRRLRVDNVYGSIHVTAYDGATVEVQAAKTIHGRSKDDIELAKKEVELKISEKNNVIDLYVDGPFRCQDGGVRSRRFDYAVNFDFEIRSPRECNLDLRTITNGDVRVEGISGKYNIENINGKIQMIEVAGFGRAHAINGGINVLYARNPTGDCSFESLNGQVEVAFPANLSADLWFKTFNGSAYTDFELTPLPTPASVPEHRDGKLVYKSNRLFGARAGKGGPRITLDAFNGNIHVTAR